ncbi:MAG: PadR family transcriptional regulator [delta proteobacterium ML8_F1]|nr:MAG: PadR family transcriptional regulator [delta proteobacterium ML8_F1]
MAREQLKNLTEPMYYLLLTLYTPRHGYEIMQMIQDITNNRVQVGAGTLYSLLSRFEKEKIIEQVDDDGRRKIYSLTNKGKGILENEHERLRALVSDGNKFIGGPFHE